MWRSGTPSDGYRSCLSLTNTSACKSTRDRSVNSLTFGKSSSTCGPGAGSSMHARLAALAPHLPEIILSNDELQRENPEWDVERIAAKTGIRERRIAAPGETSADLGYAAGRKLLEHASVDPASIDYL